MNHISQHQNVTGIQSETLSEDELAAITGYQMPHCQKRWLINNGWQHFLTGAGRPVVGRIYARLKLAGIKPSSSNTATEAWTFDPSRVA